MPRVTRGMGFVGALAIGGGPLIKKFRTGTLTVDPATLAATTKVGTAVTLTGVAEGDLVAFEPPAALEDDLVYSGSVVTADTVTIYLYNASAAPVDGASRLWRYFWFDLT